MDITDVLRQPQIAAALQSLASAYGISPVQLQSILDTIVKALSNSVERQTLSRGGLADVMAEITRPEHAAVLADPAHPNATAIGNGTLAAILGSKAASRDVAAQAAMSSGIEQAIIQKLLPIIASLIMAALSKGASGGLGDILRKLPGDMTGGAFPGGPRAPRPGRDEQDQQQGDEQGGDTPNAPQSTPSRSPIPIPGRVPAPTGGGSFGGSPLPIPGDRIPGINALNPYGNLPDVIRGGQASVDGTPVAGAIRSILGGLLGFQNKGVLSWLFRLFVLRWGWGLLQRVLQGRR